MSETDHVPFSAPTATGADSVSNGPVSVSAGALTPTGQRGAPASSAVPAGPKTQPKRSVKRLILPLILIAGIGYGGNLAYNWFVEGRFIISTDDAYIGADTAIIAAKVAGHIAQVAVPENTAVHAGDLLIKIDDGDYRLAVQSARDKIETQAATIARIGRQIDAQRAVVAQAESQAATVRAQVNAAEADVQRSALEYDRASKLAQSNYGSQQRLEQAQADRDKMIAAKVAAVSAVATADAAIQGAKANLDVLSAQKLEAERGHDELQTSLAKAERDLSFTTIVAPFDGVVGNRAAQFGEYVQPGTRLIALVPLTSTYVDANFKETQLGSIHPGQKVDVAVDSLDGRVVQGTVASLAPASGSRFSLLPPDNATGNFTKIVQRVPVRIALSPDALKSGDLRPGLSVVASIHTRDESEPPPTLLTLLGFGAQASQSKVKHD